MFASVQMFSSDLKVFFRHVNEREPPAVISHCSASRGLSIRFVLSQAKDVLRGPEIRPGCGENVLVSASPETAACAVFK